MNHVTLFGHTYITKTRKMEDLSVVSLTYFPPNKLLWSDLKQNSMVNLMYVFLVSTYIGIFEPVCLIVE